ncbi:hypothetical protein QYF36_020522 [Acer negundo]|nr:hypothetical protein QYF36_020522 [Acer negundo]
MKLLISPPRRQHKFLHIPNTNSNRLWFTISSSIHTLTSPPFLYCRKKGRPPQKKGGFGLRRHIDGSSAVDGVCSSVAVVMGLGSVAAAMVMVVGSAAGDGAGLAVLEIHWGWLNFGY